MKGYRILIISCGEFSGIRTSIVNALRNQGCKVIEARYSLKQLRFRPLYIFLMLANSIVLYRTSFRKYLYHTPIANWAFSKARHAITSQHKNIDAVISMPRIGGTYYGKKIPGVRYAILTDHVNLLSKQLPDFGVYMPERGVSPSWNEIERIALSQQDQVFVLGNFVKKSLVDDYKIDPQNVTVIGAGPNLDVDAERVGITKDFSQQNILFVGLEPERKGLPVLKRAFKKVVNVFPRATLGYIRISQPLNCSDLAVS